MRYSIEFVVGIAYITLMVGMAWMNVGDPSGPSEPFPWWLPLTMLAVCGFPFLLGYLAGKNSR